jgi:hypothetical protein
MLLLIVILLVCILLCMFKTVRIFVGIIVFLLWWNWPSTPAHPSEREPPALEINLIR